MITAGNRHVAWSNGYGYRRARSVARSACRSVQTYREAAEVTTTRPSGLESPASRLELDFPATPDQLAEVRHTMQRWLAQCPLDERQAYDVLLAVGEACTNAIEHGHRGDGGTIRLRAVRDDAHLSITVADHGRWKTPDPSPDPMRGRGMAIIRALIPEVEVTISGSGTTVDMRLPLAHGRPTG
ncbi:hypothetical protein CRM89_22755 [Nocardia sp. FDAARGOS_372]|nr:hypothetical protein CRM89_22755 [Nocardia sp. FDAARGOS_372]